MNMPRAASDGIVAVTMTPRTHDEPIFPTEALRSVDEIVELRVEGARLRCRERARASHLLGQFLESRCDLVLLVRSERRIVGNVIGSGTTQQLSISLKLSP
jgi:hypothetical protein